MVMDANQSHVPKIWSPIAIAQSQSFRSICHVDLPIAFWRISRTQRVVRGTLGSSGGWTLDGEVMKPTTQRPLWDLVHLVDSIKCALNSDLGRKDVVECWGQIPASVTRQDLSQSSRLNSGG